MKRSMWVGLCAIALALATILIATSASVVRADDPKPGTYQPVWCHFVGSVLGEKVQVQIGDDSSGTRNDTVPLMGDFGHGTTPSGQALAHDRKEKILENGCLAQIPSTTPLVNETLVDGAFVCGDKTVAQTYTKTVTPRTAVIVDGKWVVVEGTPVVTVEQRSRNMTDDEYRDNCTTKPTDYSDVATVWTDRADCDTKLVFRTGVETTTHYTYEWENSTWVEKTSTTTRDVADEPRDMTPTEIEACENPVELLPASATVSFTDAVVCKAAKGIVYTMEHATATGTASGTTGGHYKVTFTAADGYAFTGDKTTVTYEGDLGTMPTNYTCEGGDVLGGSTGEGGAAVVAQLPNTSGEGVAAIAVSGTLLALVGGAVALRRFFDRGL